MPTRRWRPRLCKDCGDVIKVYRVKFFHNWHLARRLMYWCRHCQRRLGIGDWIWGERNECLACGARFDEMDQTNHEYKNGICPCCGNYDTKPIDLLIEKEFADLKAMREASRIKG